MNNLFCALSYHWTVRLSIFAVHELFELDYPRAAFLFFRSLCFADMIGETLFLIDAASISQCRE